MGDRAEASAGHRNTPLTRGSVLADRDSRFVVSREVGTWGTRVGLAGVDDEAWVRGAANGAATDTATDTDADAADSSTGGGEEMTTPSSVYTADSRREAVSSRWLGSSTSRPSKDLCLVCIT